ncbi:MAG: ribonuclease E/G [Phycisphaerales bacterium]
MVKSQIKDGPTKLLIVNDVPGEECRIALIENDQLEELYSERTLQATGVGNIYKGRVINVEPAIQAAFIDYGSGQNGFLHISDLHPRYFPGGEDKTEQVGRKIPRRQRPLMQHALKRGDSILVQVIKEGVGTKGPTLTSYLSIPGRLMVMMPDMDRVGVSRKIEDEDLRREMRKVLDSLDLPDGIGFILRTAGFGRTKTELKRDVAYLVRLWKTMSKRIDSVQAPCALYVESDLLIRTIRDVLTPDVNGIVVDSQSGYERAIEFLRVVAPRSAPRVMRYRSEAPIFHAFDIERQIDLVHQREVTLPSGGAIVIDQTEAVVAIDVNSGRSRSARDSETNAYRTNCEAVDEICRQLRLRDLGGLVINDLIDMGKPDHRRSIEKRFRDNLARDRAKTSISRISEFGILEMTRQRMRPSIRKAHYQPCAHCQGRGAIRTPESMASEALRHVAHLLQHERVQTVEMVCSARLAADLLSARRRTLVRMEDAFGKSIKVRISDVFATDRIDYYAYDERSADVDITALPTLPRPTLEELEAMASTFEDDADVDAPSDAEESAGPKKKRRRRRGQKKVATLVDALRGIGQYVDGDDDDDDDDADEHASNAQDDDDDDARDEANNQTSQQSEGAPRKKRRRRRRRSKSAAESTPAADNNADGNADSDAAVTEDAGVTTSSPSQGSEDTPAQGASLASATGEDDKSSRRKRRRRRKRKTPDTLTAAGGSGDTAASSPESATESAEQQEEDAAEARETSSDNGVPASESGPAKKKRRRRRKKTTSASSADDASQSASSTETKDHKKPATTGSSEKPAAPEKASPTVRSLYRSRRKVTAPTAPDARDRE